MKTLKNLQIRLLLALFISTLFAATTYAAPAVKPTPAVPVKIQNTPLAVEVAPSQPFQWGEANVEFVPDQLGVQASFIVPAGKHLVIEFVSGEVYVDEGSVPNFAVITTVNGGVVAHRLLPSPVGPGGGYAQTYNVNQNMRIYADSGTEVILWAGRTLGGRGTMHVSVSGYLVDAN